VDRSPVLGLRRRRERDRADAGDLRRDDVHDDARRVDGLAARHVEAHPVDRLPALEHLGAVAEGRRGRGRHLGGAREAHPTDRLLERRAHVRVQPVDGGGDLAGRHADRGGADTVEPLRLRDERLLAVGAHLRDELGGGLRCDRDVDLRARHERRQLGAGRPAAAQIEGLDHRLRA
jgi:hypothetical protein